MSFATLSKKVAVSLQALVMVLGVGGAAVSATVVASTPAYAATPCTDVADPSSADPLGSGASCSKTGSQKENLFGAGGIFTVIAYTLIFLVGALSVIYLILGGLKYVTSNGDAKAVSSAKDTILYAIIGVVVAVVSFALVQFVITQLGKAS